MAAQGIDARALPAHISRRQSQVGQGLNDVRTLSMLCDPHGVDDCGSIRCSEEFCCSGQVWSGYSRDLLCLAGSIGPRRLCCLLESSGALLYKLPINEILLHNHIQ